MANAQPIPMPLRGTPNTPKFNGKTLSQLPRYLKDINLLGDQAGLDQEKKIKAALHYADLEEAELWEMLPEATNNPAD